MLVERIKNFCKNKGVSFVQFERESGLGEHSVYRWDNNSPTPSPDPAVMQKISLSDRNIRERYYELTRQERQMLWRNMVESIVVRENVVDITWRQS